MCTVSVNLSVFRLYKCETSTWNRFHMYLTKGYMLHFLAMVRVWFRISSNMQWVRAPVAM